MPTLLLAIAVGVAFIVAYRTYGRWLGSRIFNLAADRPCPSQRLYDGKDYVPTAKSIIFGHHFTSIAATGPIVGPAIAVMWGWLPALLWVVFGSIFIGAVHDLGSLVVSLRSNGQTVGDIAGRVLNKRVRVLFLAVLFLALTIIIAIFGLVIAAVFRQYPAAIFPVIVQLPIAVVIGLWLHRKGASLVVPSIIALVLMYLAVIYGNVGLLGEINAWFASWPTIVWVAVLLVYCYIASVLPVWVLLQPRDYINALQLISALALVVLGLFAAAMFGGAPPVEGAERQPLEIAAPMVNWNPEGAPLIIPFLFITIACGAISGFHCLVSSGTTSKQLKKETDAQFVGYGSMLTEGFLATLVILACVAGLGLGASVMSFQPASSIGQPQLARHVQFDYVSPIGEPLQMVLTNQGWMVRQPGEHMRGEAADFQRPYFVASEGVWIGANTIVGTTQTASDLVVDIERPDEAVLVGATAFNTRYTSWRESGALANTVGAFVDGSANFLAAMGIPAAIAVALMGVFVASFAATTLDTATRLQRYVIQELAAVFVPRPSPTACPACGYELAYNVSGACPECGREIDRGQRGLLPYKAGTGGPGASATDAPAESNAARHEGAPPRSASLDGGDAGSQSAPSPYPSHPRHSEGGLRGALNPFLWLTNRYVATLLAVVVAGAIAALPAPGQAWSWQTAGGGGMILWPMFGATNQLMAGLAFLVIAFWLWRRRKPIFFIVIPLIFMLIMPAWAMLWQVFIADADAPGWLFSDNPRWVLIFIALATVALEVWMIVEAIRLWPRVRGVVEEADGLAPAAAEPEPEVAAV